MEVPKPLRLNPQWTMRVGYDVDFTIYGVTDEVDMVKLGHNYQKLQ